jgi:tetratricopeptide (TPR) repeat protein
MAILKTAVFLASRFDEFNLLRVELKRKISDYTRVDFTPIDLNDGRVSHRPPLIECLANVRRSEFMILLMGDSYGECAPNHNKSFTHLEYLEAIREGSNTRVLVFCIGDSYKDRRITYSKVASMAKWQRQLQKRHTIGFIDSKTEIQDMAEKIFHHLLEVLYDIRFGQVSVIYDEEYGDTIGIMDANSESVVMDDTEVARLTEINASAKGLSITDEADKYQTTFDMLKHPNAIAALEHQREADLAIELADYAAAISHLKRALKLKPLDLMSNYWLARLYVALEYKHKYREIIELLERAIRIAKLKQADVRISACYQIAARAAIMVGKLEEAEDYAKASVDVASFYSRSFIELARVQVLRGNKEEAVSNIKEAFDRYSPSLREVIGDPAFYPVRNEIDGLLQRIKANLRRKTTSLCEAEQRLSLILGQECNHRDVNEKRTIPALIHLARESIKNQHEYLVDIVTQCKTRWEREMIEENWDGIKKTTVCFEFSFPSSVTITHWLKKSGEIVEPKGAVFRFVFEGNSKERTWVWRGSESIKICDIFKNAQSVFNQNNATLFDFIPADAWPNRINKLSYAKAQLEELEQKQNQINRALEEQKKILQDLLNKARPVKEILFAVILASIIFVFFHYNGWGIVGIVLAVYVLYAIGKDANKAKHSKIEPVKRKIQQNKLEIEKLDEILSSLPNKIEELQSMEKEVQALTDKVIELFSNSLLTKSQLVPFGNLTTAKNHDIVRTSMANIERYQNQFEKKVDIEDDIPPYLEHLRVYIERDYFLAKIKSVTPDAIVISVAEAYIDKLSS